MFGYNRTKHKGMNALAKDKVYAHYCKYARRNWSHPLAQVRKRVPVPKHEKPWLLLAFFFPSTRFKPLQQIIELQQDLK
jgi:hypothetical protein